MSVLKNVFWGKLPKMLCYDHDTPAFRYDSVSVQEVIEA